MSLVPFNSGTGPLELTSSSEESRHTMYQIIHRADGTQISLPAGSTKFHPAHHHYHLVGFLALELLRVRATGPLAVVRQGKKVGFCPTDTGLVNWYDFYQDPVFTVETDCTKRQATMGLSTGWADIYTAATVGNYLDVKGSPDGEYVVRATIDPVDNIRETNEGDNAAYAHLLLVNGRVRVLSRGYGRGPLDPRAELVQDWWDEYLK